MEEVKYEVTFENLEQIKTLLEKIESLSKELGFKYSVSEGNSSSILYILEMPMKITIK